MLKFYLYTVIPRKLAIPNSRNSLTRGSSCSLDLLFFTSKLAVPLLSTQIRDFCYFLSPKIREFGGITVLTTFWQVSETWGTLLYMRSTYSENMTKIERGNLILEQILYFFI